MYIKSKYPIRWKMQYVPTYYEGLSEEQQRDQQIVLDFKDGIYDEELMLWFRQNIWKLTEGDEYSWSVCFLAKTIHPNLPMKEKNSQRESDETIIREEAEIMKTLSDLPTYDIKNHKIV